MRSRSRRAAVLTTVLIVLGAASCGLPSSGVRRVDDDAVPYRLLESGSPSGSPSATGAGPGRRPAVFWLDGRHGDELVSEPVEATCADPTRAVVDQLVKALRAGPSDASRARGRSSALPPDSGLDLVAIDDGTVEVDIEPETSLSADRLPVAVGQVVLTLTSAPEVTSVLVVSEGAPAQVPLPGGVLTDGPVTAADYGDLVERRAGGPPYGCAAGSAD